MTDTPVVHGTPNPDGHGIKGFMSANTAGMPNWVWLLVIAGGIGLALAVKHFTSGKSGNATTTGTTPDSGLGLAVDPTTGLPYAVEGLVPAGGTVGMQPPSGTSSGGGTTDTTKSSTPTVDPRFAQQEDFSWIGTLKPGTTYSLGGYDPTTNLQRFWYTEPGGVTQEKWLPAGSTIVKGAQGRIWINPSGLPRGQQGRQVTGTSPTWPGSTQQQRILA